MGVRAPAVRGTFYPGDREELEALLAELMPVAAKPVIAIGVVAPHAGYLYSGGVAGAVFGRVSVPDAALVLGPNHTGIGPALSVYPGGAWKTPLGDVPIHEGLTRQVLEHVVAAVAEESAHRREHSAEVELNFLLRRNANLKAACLAVGSMPLREAQKAGDGLAAAVRAAGEPVLLVASSDMSHYLPDAEARAKDRRALEALLALDEAELWKRVNEEDITMCGYIPACIAVRAAKALGATRAELVAYGTSGDVSGDFENVVGYAGVILN